MITFILVMLAIIAVGFILTLFVGTGSVAVFLIFGDVIIGAFLVYKIIKMLVEK